MDIKLFDSELKVMCVLWSEGDTTAKHISDVLKKEIGWNRPQDGISWIQKVVAVELGFWLRI